MSLSMIKKNLTPPSHQVFKKSFYWLFLLCFVEKIFIFLK